MSNLEIHAIIINFKAISLLFPTICLYEVQLLKSLSDNFSGRQGV